MDGFVWFVIILCIGCLLMLGGMGWHMKVVAQPERTRQLRATARQRRVDKLA